MNLIDPYSGGSVTKQSDGTYKSNYTNMSFLFDNKNDQLIPIKDPFNGGTMTKNQDGTYKSDYTGLNFTYDDKRKCFIPNYIPDDDLFELAHIEVDYLVGDSTGNRYRIDDNGRILTPDEIRTQYIQGSFDEKYKEEFKDILDKISNDEKVLEIKRDGYLKVWMINHDIQDFDEHCMEDNQEYLDTTIKIRDLESRPIVYDINIDTGICYFCSAFVDNSNMENHNLQARTFNFDDNFVDEFLVPFLTYMSKEDIYSNSRIIPNEKNSNICNFYLVDGKSSYVALNNVDVRLVKSIFEKIDKYQVASIGSDSYHK